MPCADLPLVHRLLHGIRAFILYLGKLLVPVDLIPFYSYPIADPLLSIKHVGILLGASGIAASCVVLVKAGKGRSWTAAWGYYLITLLPVLGIVQVGNQSMADRYIYVPSLGPFLLAGLGLALVTERAKGAAEGKWYGRYYLFVLMGALVGQPPGGGDSPHARR